MLMHFAATEKECFAFG